MKRLVIFAAGAGTNPERIIRFFGQGKVAKVVLVMSNRKDAGVHDRCSSLGVPSITFSRQDFYQSEVVLQILRETSPSLLILAGFLWLVPENILKSYPDRILNIHPALLPEFGGPGMYGQRVHEAVLASGKSESGITIHTIDHEYDRGKVIFQATCPVLSSDTPESLATRIHALEYEHYPRVIRDYLLDLRD